MCKVEEKCCGGCCWFCFEECGGWGQCMQQDECDSMHCSDLCTTDEYVSREEMRHHMKVLLTVKYWFEGNHMHAVMPHELHEAFAFAYKYMKVFCKL